MMKKILFLFLLINFCFMQQVKADDFHKYTEYAPANSIKNFNYEDLNRIPVKIKIISDVTTKKNLTEGQKLVFLTTEDTVLTHKKVLPAQSRIIGTVDTISKNQIKGIPANLIVGNFKIEYMPTVKLNGQICKQGANRTLWVKPLMPLFFYVKGGYAKIKSSETYVIYHTPEDL